VPNEEGSRISNGSLAALVAGLEKTVEALQRTVRTLEERVNRHEDNCLEAYAEARASRESLRTEVMQAFGTLDEKQDRQHAENKTSISRVHDRMNAAVYAVLGLTVTIILGLAGVLWSVAYHSP